MLMKKKLLSNIKGLYIFLLLPFVACINTRGFSAHCEFFPFIHSSPLFFLLPSHGVPWCMFPPMTPYFYMIS